MIGQRRLATVLVLFAGCSLTGLQAADVAVLTNGDRLTGTVQKLEAGMLHLKSKYSESPLEIDWTLVASLATESELTVKLSDGSGHTGKLVVGHASPIQPNAIVAIAPKTSDATQEPSSWLSRAWENSSFSIDVDQNYSGLTRYNQFSSNTEIEYNGKRWDGVLVTHTDYYGATDSADSTYQAYSRLMARRYVQGDHFFLFPYWFLGRQTTSEGGKGQIRQYGGGVGWTVHRHRSDQVSLYAGLARSNGHGFVVAEELRTDSHTTDNLLMGGISWEKTLRGGIHANMRLYCYRPIGVAGHFSMATDSSLKLPLFGPAYLTIGAYDTPEIRQHQVLSTRNLQITSGIGIAF